MFDKAKDPVCGMKISKKTAPATSEYMRLFTFVPLPARRNFIRTP